MFSDPENPISQKLRSGAAEPIVWNLGVETEQNPNLLTLGNWARLSYCCAKGSQRSCRLPVTYAYFEGTGTGTTYIGTQQFLETGFFGIV